MTRHGRTLYDSLQRRDGLIATHLGMDTALTSGHETSQRRNNIGTHLMVSFDELFHISPSLSRYHLLRPVPQAHPRFPCRPPARSHYHTSKKTPSHTPNPQRRDAPTLTPMLQTAVVEKTSSYEMMNVDGARCGPSRPAVPAKGKILPLPGKCEDATPIPCPFHVSNVWQQLKSSLEME